MKINRLQKKEKEDRKVIFPGYNRYRRPVIDFRRLPPPKDSFPFQSILFSSSARQLLKKKNSFPKLAHRRRRQSWLQKRWQPTLRQNIWGIGGRSFFRKQNYYFVTRKVFSLWVKKKWCYLRFRHLVQQQHKKKKLPSFFSFQSRSSNLSALSKTTELGSSHLSSFFKFRTFLLKFRKKKKKKLRSIQQVFSLYSEQRLRFLFSRVSNLRIRSRIDLLGVQKLKYKSIRKIKKKIIRKQNRLNFPSFLLSSVSLNGDDSNQQMIPFYFQQLSSPSLVTLTTAERSKLTSSSEWTLSFIPGYNNFWSFLSHEEKKINYMMSTGQIQNKMTSSRRRSVFGAVQVVEKIARYALQQLELIRRQNELSSFVFVPPSPAMEEQTQKKKGLLSRSSFFQHNYLLSQAYQNQRQVWFSKLENHPSQRLLVKLHNWSSSLDLKRYWNQLLLSFFELCGNEARWQLRVQPVYSKPHNGLRKKKKRRL